jgi:predicted small metal-binding protein
MRSQSCGLGSREDDMAYEFGCKVAGSACNWKARGSTPEEVMRKVAEHAHGKHNVAAVSDTIADYLESTLRQS